MADAAGAVSAPAAPTSAPNGAPAAARNNSGQFSPKDGATGIQPPAAKPAAPPVAKVGEPPPVEKKPEPYRFKRKVGEREVDLDEGGIEQHIKELDWRRKQQGELTSTKKELADLKRLAETDEDGFFKALGIDVDARAERKIAERLRMAQLTPQEQELERLKAEIDKRDMSVKEREKQLETQAKEARREQVRQANRQEYEQALGASVLPHSRAKLFLMSQIQRGLLDSGAPKMSPEHLGRAYDDMMLSAFDEVVNAATTKPETLQRWPNLPKLGVAALGKLDGEALLAELGPALTRKVLQASVANHRGQQTIPSQRTEAPRPPESREGSFDEVELENRKRAFFATFK